MRTVFVNGSYIPEDQASISIFDRGFLFADAVYEVFAVLDGRLADFQAHVLRLQRSLGEIGLPEPIWVSQLQEIGHQLIKANALQEGLMYLQVSRGPAERDFAFPTEPTPTLIAFTQKKPVSGLTPKGIRVITTPDIRWARCDIKTVSLLAASMAKQAALDQGADDAWWTRDGYVTEGASSNAFIVTADKKIVTRQLGNDILAGITRAVILEIAQLQNLTVEERPIAISELGHAQEAFASAASMFVMPVVQIDGAVIGNGRPGPIVLAARASYIEKARQTLT